MQVSASTVDIEKSIAKVAQSYRFTAYRNQDNVSKLAADIEKSDALRHFDSHALHEVLINAFSHITEEIKKTTGAVPLYHSPDVTVKLDDVVKTANHISEHKKKPIIADSARSNILRERMNSASAHLKPERIKPNSWENLATEHKVNAAMWGVGALMSAFGVLSAAKYAVAHDDEGKSHVQWSQVGVGALQLLLAAGCTYMGVQAVRTGRSVG